MAFAYFIAKERSRDPDAFGTGTIEVPIELMLIGGLIVLASIVGYLPAMSAYRTDVARSLSRTP